MTKDLNHRKHEYARPAGATTVGQLRRRIAVFDDEDVIIFTETDVGSPVVFNRTRSRGAELVQIELTELADGWSEEVF